MSEGNQRQVFTKFGQAALGQPAQPVRMTESGTAVQDKAPGRDPLPDMPVAFFEVLRRRRSVRAYDSRRVEPEKVRAILAAANSAPSAANLQGYEIVVVTEPATQQALVGAAFNQAFVAKAPVLLLFCAHTKRSQAKFDPQSAEFYALQDATVACAYAELAAAALDLGAVWIGVDSARAAQITQVSPDWKPIALLCVGYRGESPVQTPRRGVSDLAHGLLAGA